MDPQRGGGKVSLNILGPQARPSTPSRVHKGVEGRAEDPVRFTNGLPPLPQPTGARRLRQGTPARKLPWPSISVRVAWDPLQQPRRQTPLRRGPAPCRGAGGVGNGTAAAGSAHPRGIASGMGAAAAKPGLSGPSRPPSAARRGQGLHPAKTWRGCLASSCAEPETAE